MKERPLTTINQAGEDSAPVFEVEEPTDGQVLAYDGDSGKWKNADAGGALVVIVTEVDGVPTCDKTAGEMWVACQTGVVLFRYESSESDETVELLTSGGFNSESGYAFASENLSLSAATENDYPSGGGGD